ncbi:MAG TPA: glycosyltransferase [Chloroflexota bacterium]|nr:glycosyltransferase [Chloroflexota bacterium]
MGVSVVVTVRNEESTVDDLIGSLLAQSRQPDEIVISDGGSIDGTVGTVESWIARGAPIRLLRCPGANIAAGRNRAIEAASGEIIACTDAGTRLDPRWLEKIVAPFAQGYDVAMGFFHAAPQSLFERALAATTLPHADEIDPTKFIPSSRSIAFSREAWARVGGYPEWLDYCEDVIFDLGLRDAGLRFAWVPDAVVYYRPRGTLAAFARQYYLYARGDGKANLWPRRHAVRYLAYTLAPLALVLGFWYKRLWLAAAIGAGLYLCMPYRRLARDSDDLTLGERLLAAALIPLLRGTGDVAKMLGYPVGVSWRARTGRKSGGR